MVSNSVKASDLYSCKRIALAVAAQADHLAQMVEHDQMLAPEMVQRLQQDGLLDVTHHVGTPLRDLGRHVLVGALLDARQQLLVGDALFLGPVLDRQVEIEHALQLFLQPRDVPLLGIGMLGHVLGDEILDEGVAHVGDGLGDVLVLHQIDALVEDHLALVVLDVVELRAGSCGCRSCAPRPSAAPSPAPC